MSDPESTFSEHMRAHLRGDREAMSRLIPLVYDELRRIASRQMQQERGSHTLQPTALVNEALVRLMHADLDLRGRTEFLRLAARTMRRVLVDHARARGAQKRAADRVPLTGVDLPSPEQPDPVDVVALHEALLQLEGLSERQAQVVELRFFGGLTLEEAAEVMGIERSTAKDHWTMARSWLNRRLADKHAD